MLLAPVTGARQFTAPSICDDVTRIRKASGGVRRCGVDADKADTLLRRHCVDATRTERAVFTR